MSGDRILVGDLGAGFGTSFGTSFGASFDVCGELPGPGVTLLEASAGTGKTFTIASLAARYLAERHGVDELLVVTFTRAATGELRDRVRRRLVETAEGLSRAGAGVVPDDPLVALLAAGGAEVLAERRRRLEAALSRFDGATITTTHGFCQQMLAGLGVAGEPLYDVSFAEDLDDLVGEVVDDLYVRSFAAAHDTGGDGGAEHGGAEEDGAEEDGGLGGYEPPFRRAEAGEIAALAVANRGLPVEPSGLAPGDPDDERRRFALLVRAELDRRQRGLQLITYDDLQTRLAEALTDPRRGAAARARLAGRYRVVLVDEFQDTDPVQWEILRSAFAEQGVTLVLIGDPKQAIYSFRGADVLTYLAAAEQATRRASLGVNWRSDGSLLAALDALFAGAQLGDPRITYRPAAPAPGHEQTGLSGAPRVSPLRLRVLSRRRLPPTHQGREVSVPAARTAIIADLVEDVRSLLDTATSVRDVHSPGEGQRPIRPGDVAVLVQTNFEAREVRDALSAAGVPAVMLGTDSVFSTEAATAWLHLLEALERPGDRGRLARVALGEFVGWRAERVALAADEAWADLAFALHRYDAELRERGVAALFSTLLAEREVPARLLARGDGERMMTDLAHVAQLLHAAAIEQHLGERALTGWLARRIDSAAEEDADEGLSRRLEHDADAIQVITVHRSKGLEFPVVYLPFLWTSRGSRDRRPFVFHDPADGSARKVDVGSDSGRSAAHRREHQASQRGEALRLAYVATTRGRHQVVLWWAPGTDAGGSPLGRLLFGRGEDGSVADNVARLPGDADTLAALDRLAAAAPAGTIAVEPVEAGGHPPPGAERHPVGAPARPARGGDVAPSALEVAELERAVDASWRRTSYSALVADSHADPAAAAADPAGADPSVSEALADEPSEREGVAAADEAGGSPGSWGPPAATPVPAPPPGGDSDERAVPLATLPGGVDIGTFVHQVLQELDFAATDLEEAVRERIESTPGRDRLTTTDRRLLAAGLALALRTPLGPLFGDATLAGTARSDRLDELDFELPLAGGDEPRGTLELSLVADVLEAHLAPGDPLAGYPRRLRDPLLQRAFRGYLTGSIDLVLRHRSGSGTGSATGPDAGAGGSAGYLVADYKTNRLAGPGVELRAGHYRPEALAEAMMTAHYPLQALLYAVALHRYLRWRSPGYDPARQLRGIAYLFLRGMLGADAPRARDGQPYGVFAWALPAGLVEALSEALDVGRPAAAPGRSPVGR